MWLPRVRVSRTQAGIAVQTSMAATTSMVTSKETRGGYTITVDRDASDAPVAITG
ncbi:hypothetical protein GCM10022233_66830 [Streptomyces shaanxiensis]|uniref:Uncharacterized protein n=1 Tax=Streptomyces shaanxiensis TaxID=653357 RepID=A0ABP7W181_9ACTN